jgi:2-amino-4-hydroxy-6-hydroxymethyldihydropteridine diphosphokinase
MVNVILLIGGNLGNRFENIELTTALISEQIGEIVNKSSIYETQAWEIDTNQNFLNQVLILKSDLKPYEILEKINYIESKLGRIRDENKRWISRAMDVDILFYNDLVLEDEALTIPHKRLAERKFTLAPLNELMSDYIHPKLGKSIGDLYEKCEDKSWVKIVENGDKL